MEQLFYQEMPLSHWAEARESMSKSARRVTGKDRELANAVRHSKAPAIARAAAILRLLGKSDRPLTLQTIAKELGLVPSTCLYTLRALVEEEFVALEPDTKRYSLEAGVLTLARHWLRRNQFTDLAQPMMDSISAEFGVTTLGVNIVGLDHIVVVAVAHSDTNFQLSAQIGSRFPALISATGRCIAAYSNFEEGELQARFNSLRWDNAPEYSQWLAEVQQVKVDGVAVDPGNYIDGVTVVAAPVWKVNKVLGHAIVALGIGNLSSKDDLHALQDRVRQSAEVLSNQLSGTDR